METGARDNEGCEKEAKEETEEAEEEDDDDTLATRGAESGDDGDEASEEDRDSDGSADVYGLIDTRGNGAAEPEPADVELDEEDEAISWRTARGRYCGRRSLLF